MSITGQVDDPQYQAGYRDGFENGRQWGADYAELQRMQETHRILGDPQDCCVVPTSGEPTSDGRQSKP